jgi:phosphoglycerate dehydrogenase-like enzyme
MSTSKVAYVADINPRAEYIKNLTPPDLEVVLVDISLSDEAKISLCQDADAIISSNVSVNVLKQCPKVKLIQTLSAGYDRMDLEDIGEMGIPIANNGGANAIAVSEQTIALMIAVSKKTMLHWETAMRRRQWRQGIPVAEMFEITNKTVGIVGLGRIGKQVARRLKGFDTRTLYYDIVEIPQKMQEELNVQPAPFEELLQESDIVTLHVPLNRHTRHMISERELGMMKATAYLINACRGPVVDEKALYQALKQQRIAGAGLDVLEQEPTPVDNPLFELDNVVITPHMAGTSNETNLRAANFSYSNIQRVLAGNSPESLVTPDY